MPNFLHQIPRPVLLVVNQKYYDHGCPKNFHLHSRLLTMIQIFEHSPIVAQNIKCYKKNFYQLHLRGICH